MRKRDFEELKGLTEKDLVHRRDEIARKLYEQRVQLRLGQLKDFSTIRRLRKDIAQINTVLRQKQLQHARSSNG
jgi:ribosomal protein L29